MRPNVCGTLQCWRLALNWPIPVLILLPAAADIGHQPRFTASLNSAGRREGLASHNFESAALARDRKTVAQGVASGLR